MRTPTREEKDKWTLLAARAAAEHLPRTAELLKIYGGLPPGYKINNHLYDDLKDIQKKLEQAFKL